MKQWLFSSDGAPDTLPLTAVDKTDSTPRMYCMEDVDCGDGILGIRIRYDRADGCNQVRVCDDNGVTYGVIMATSYIGAQITYADIAPITGVKTLYLIPSGRLVILGAELLDHSPYDEIHYEPIPEDAVFDNGHETWVATDELGRAVKNCEDVGRRRGDRQVGIFYWTWRDQQSSSEPLNLTQVLRDYPGAEYNENHPVWTKDGKPTVTNWNEPLYGYYLNRDPYIIRRHAVMLANAGVDFLVFDCTNGSLIWKQSYEPLLEGLRAARADGIRVPKVAFMLNFGIAKTSEDMLRTLYQDLYKPGRYSDLWYMLDGKPMIMAYRGSLPEVGVCDFDTALLDEIRNFFTFRAGQPSYGFGDTWHEPMWGWLEKAPQHKFGEREDGSCEMMTVGVAQNCNAEKLCTCFNAPHTFGRSYTHAYGEAFLDEESYKYGYNFQEQWERALDVDPDIVFVTGWNEWIMGRWHEPWIDDPNSTQLAFVDQYNLEYSRDIEPDADGIRDNYYLQLCSNIRRYKGAGKRPIASAPKTAVCFDDFADAKPVYYNDRGTTVHRDCDGFGSTHYTNDTGRNDIIRAKVLRDERNFYFYVECAGNIVMPDAENGMMLLLNTDGDPDTGWNGYNYAVNRKESGVGCAIVERWTGSGWCDHTVVQYLCEGTRMMLTLPREFVGLETDPVSFAFKWVDNIPLDDIIAFYRDGDTAPMGRFAYLYRT